MPALLRPTLVAIVIGVLTVAATARAQDPVAVSWATAQATELSRQARDHAARGEPDAAITRYVEAIRLDPTYAPAYMGLAAQYEGRGDVREAERTYAVGLDHVPGFTDALMARARLRQRTHRREEAIADLETAMTIDGDSFPLLRELLAAYVATKALPAALSVARRMVAVAEGQRDGGALAEARVKARALGLLVGEIDPVMAGRSGRGAVRSALWAGLKKRY